jgi:hypothetical protein
MARHLQPWYWSLGNIQHRCQYWVPVKTYHLPQHVYLDGEKIMFCSAADIEDMNAALGSVRVIYYRPYGWIPALRIELPAPVSASNTRLSLVLEGITRQFFSPAVVEPYPLFLADRMVKRPRLRRCRDRASSIPARGRKHT